MKLSKRGTTDNSTSTSVNLNFNGQMPWSLCRSSIYRLMTPPHSVHLCIERMKQEDKLDGSNAAAGYRELENSEKLRVRGLIERAGGEEKALLKRLLANANVVDDVHFEFVGKVTALTAQVDDKDREIRDLKLKLSELG